MEALRASRYRYLVPNAVTFLSLASGVGAILAGAGGHLSWGGGLILLSYVLDLLDGELARRLEASSQFGLQLDSLVDLVSLGVAPATLAFFHLQAAGLDGPLTWLVVIVYVAAGAFRLARFNLLPVKSGQTESVGLTISTGGATVTLGILSDIGYQAEVVPDVLFLPFLLGLALLMASRIPHPSITWLFSYRAANLFYVLYFAVTLFLLRLPAINVWFLFNSGYLGATLIRAGVRHYE